MDKLSLILSGAAVLLNLVVLLVLLFRGRERRDALTYDQLRRELAEQNRLTAQQVSLLGQELDTSFKNAGQIIGTNIDQMTRMVDRRLQSLQEDNARKLDSMRQTVDEKLQKTLETRLGESFKAVGDQLERVYKGLGDMQSLAAGVGDLKKVLTNVKTRGTWGEISLGSLLEQVLTPQQYRANVKVAPRRGEIVEYAICLPGKEDGADTVYLPIDSKFPMESYIRLTEAAERGEPAEVDTASRQLEASIKENARSIRDKYIVPPHTTDFAIMFLPTEGLYAEVTRRAELCTVLQRDYRVTIMGPTTLGAFLNSLQMGFRTVALQKRSGEVLKLLAAVKEEFQKYGEAVQKARTRLEQASGDLDAIDTRARALTRKLRDVGEDAPALAQGDAN